MDTKNRYSKEEFDSIINRIETINDIKERLKYVDAVKEQYSEIFFPKKGIKLLSSVNDKIVDDFKRRVNRLVDELENRLHASDNKNEDEIRSVDSYIQWNGQIKQLRDLLSKLIKNKYIIVGKEVSIEKLIDEHFYVEDYSVPKDGKVKSIKWGKTKPDLMHLFEILLNNNLLSHFKKDRHKIVSYNFMNMDNINYEAEELDKEYYKYRRKVYKNGNRFEELDKIIEEITSEEFD